MRTFFRHYIIMKIFRWLFCVLVHYQMLHLILLLTLSQVLLNFSDSLSSFIRKKYIYFHKIFLHTLSFLEALYIMAYFLHHLCNHLKPFLQKGIFLDIIILSIFTLTMLIQYLDY